jgi:hypothetical protein
VKLLKLTQIENGKTFFINYDEIASINPTFKLKPEVILGEDHNIYFTLITLKNGVKVNATETPEQIAYAFDHLGIMMPRNVNGPSGPSRRPYDGVTDPAPAWSPDANLERSKACCATGPVNPSAGTLNTLVP